MEIIIKDITKDDLKEIINQVLLIRDLQKTLPMHPWPYDIQPIAMYSISSNGEK